jgi:hypothetical protein
LSFNLKSDSIWFCPYKDDDTILYLVPSETGEYFFRTWNFETETSKTIFTQGDMPEIDL